MSYACYPEMTDSGLAHIGLVPSHWAYERAKFLFRRMNRPIRESDEIVTAFRNGEVTLRKNRREEGFTNALKEIGYQGIRKGDLVIHAMDGFAGAIGVSDSDGKSSPVYSACVPIRDEVVPEYYARLLRDLALNGFVESLAKGVRERSTEFRFAEFKELTLLVPPHSEQAAIAKFLNRETAKIDTLIEKQEQLIKLLEEKRQAVISHAVTKGLNPDVRMKDSGVEWLGEVPEHWAVTKLKHLASMKSGDGITAESIEAEGQYPVYGGNGIRGYTASYTHEGKYPLIGRQGALCGNVNYASGRFWASEHAVVVAPREKVYFKWLGEVLRAMNLNQYSISAAQPGLSVDTIANLFIPHPSEPEQRAIAEYLDRSLDQGTAVRDMASRGVELLKERRTALISAAVTGKIDVRNAD